MKSLNSRSLAARLSSLVVLGVLVGSCQGAEKFPYKYYGLDAEPYAGKLLDSSEDKDLPFSLCRPDGEHKCIVMMVPEFELFRLDWVRLKESLAECQKEK